MAWHSVLFFLLLAALPVQLGYHFWPQWALVYGRRIDYLSPTLYILDVLVAAVVVLWITQPGFRSHAVQKKKRRRFLYPLCITGALIVAGINTGFAVVPPAAAIAWFRVFAYLCLSLYIIRTKPDLRLVVAGFAAGVTYVSVIACMQFILQHSVGGLLWYLGERTFSLATPGIARLSFCLNPWGFTCGERLRAYGTFPHPNVLGGYIAVALPFLIDGLRRAKRGGVRVVYGVILLVAVSALAVTFSRTAWVAAAVGIVLRIPFLRKYGIPGRAAYIIIAITGILAAIVYKPSITDESFTQRLQLNAAAITVWQSRPLTGSGLNNFIAAVPLTSPRLPLQPVHNVYLLFLAETGIAGVLVVVIVLIFLLRRMYTVRQYESKYIVSFVQLCIIGAADHYPITLIQGQLITVLLVSLFISSMRLSD